MNVHNRGEYYHLPVHCGFCGQKVLDQEDESAHSNPCQHTLFVGHDEGWEYISDRMRAEMADLGFKVTVSDDGFIEVEGLDDDEHFGHPNDLIEMSKFPDALAVIATVGMPSGFSTYVAFAPVRNEG